MNHRVEVTLAHNAAKHSITKEIWIFILRGMKMEITLAITVTLKETQEKPWPNTWKLSTQ